jgi:hypothetical protein
MDSVALRRQLYLFMPRLSEVQEDFTQFSEIAYEEHDPLMCRTESSHYHQPVHVVLNERHGSLRL